MLCRRDRVLSKRLLRYLSGTSKQVIFYARSHGPSEPFQGYSDSDWAGRKDTLKCISGIVVNVNKYPAHWTSTACQCTALPPPNPTEYVAISLCAKQLTALGLVFFELCVHMPCESEPPLRATTLRTDNTAKLSLATNLQVSERNKHIEIRMHHIRDLIQTDIITLSHITTSIQIADVLRKPRPSGAFDIIV